jgi:hypothetical protein
MKPRSLRTSDVARAAGVHPNTVRLYEERGFLPPIPRNPSGYRLFTEAHVDQMRLARTALRGPWPGRNIKRSALALVRRAASGDLGGALEQAYSYLVLTWVVPVGVMTTVLAQALTGELPARMLIGSVALATALLVGSSALFRSGLRRYASASS